MEDLEFYPIQLELKYCERCGGLWLRPKGSDLIFCAGCAKSMAGVPPLWPRGAKPLDETDDSGSSTVFWGEGGNA